MSNYHPSSMIKILNEMPSEEYHEIEENDTSDLENNYPPFNSLDGCIYITIPFEIPQPCHDPLLDGWITRIDVAAGGSALDLFYRRAMRNLTIALGS